MWLIGFRDYVLSICKMDISGHLVLTTETKLNVLDTEKAKSNSVAPSFPRSPFYFFFCCFRKRIFIEEPYYQYYTQIFDYVYTTDGRLYIGYYKKCPLTNIRKLEYDDINPDYRYCLPCRLINYLCRIK